MSVIPKQTPAVRQPTPQGVSAPASGVTGAIQQAAQATGASFDYLLATAKVESEPQSQSRRSGRSSATGLFQFIEQTWLGTMKKAGQGARLRQLCRRDLAQVRRAAIRWTIRAAQRDPATAQGSAANAADGRRLHAAQRRRARASGSAATPTDGELYIAHFFGAGGAAQARSMLAREQSASQCGRDVSGRGARQPLDLLRQAGQCAQRRRASMPSSIAATRSRAPMSMPSVVPTGRRCQLRGARGRAGRDATGARHRRH